MGFTSGSLLLLGSEDLLAERWGADSFRLSIPLSSILTGAWAEWLPLFESEIGEEGSGEMRSEEWPRDIRDRTGAGICIEWLSIGRISTSLLMTYKSSAEIEESESEWFILLRF